MNRINRLFQNKNANILSIYFTAGYPSVDSTVTIIKALADAGTDMIEIGIPFSDPMADGPVIQNSSTVALKNGMSLKLLFKQLKNIRKEVDIPLLLMGYINPVMQYDIENFCNDCVNVGIDGVILPDLPLEIYQDDYKSLFIQHDLNNVFLISPQTRDERIYKIDSVSRGFIYMVSSSSTTGIKGSFAPEQLAYFERIRKMKLSNPALIGFGISNHESYNIACNYARGAIIGSAFVKMLSTATNLKKDIGKFVGEMRGGLTKNLL